MSPTLQFEFEHAQSGLTAGFGWLTGMLLRRPVAVGVREFLSRVQIAPNPPNLPIGPSWLTCCAPRR
jgi:hypothetical protein